GPMGAIQDLLQQVPLSAVLKERVALAEQKYETVLRENTDLKQRLFALEQKHAELLKQLPKQLSGNMGNDTAKVLAYLFRAEDDDRDVGAIAQMLQMERGLVRYHLDQLESSGYADCVGGNYVSGHIYWALTPAGRKLAVEQKLI